MKKSDQLKIAAIILYMLNPLGILAFVSEPAYSFQKYKLPSLLARHNFEPSQRLAQAVTHNAAMHQKMTVKSNRVPASARLKDYSCMKRLNQ